MSTRAQTHSLFVGLATLDIILGVETFPDSNQKVVASRESIAAGGPAANAAVTCAFLGCPAVLLTALGGTSLAEVIRAELAEQSVSVVDMDPKTACPPPVAAIIVTLPSGDRTVVSPGAVQSTAEPNETFGALILASCAVLVDGHHPKLALAAVRSAREAGIHTILDGGSWKKTTGTLLPFVDTAICSNDFRPPDVRREDILEFLQAQGVRHAAITRGSEPILWASGGDRGEIAVAAHRVIDTLGAGDVFHGAFTAATYEKQMTPALFRSALAYAGTIASNSCASFGTRSWMSAGPAELPESTTAGTS